MAAPSPLQLLQALSDDDLSWARAERLLEAVETLRDQLEELATDVEAWREADAGQDRRDARETATATAGEALMELRAFVGSELPARPAAPAAQAGA